MYPEAVHPQDVLTPENQPSVHTVGGCSQNEHLSGFTITMTLQSANDGRVRCASLRNHKFVLTTSIVPENRLWLPACQEPLVLQFQQRGGWGGGWTTASDGCFALPPSGYKINSWFCCCFAQSNETRGCSHSHKLTVHIHTEHHHPKAPRGPRLA